MKTRYFKHKTGFGDDTLLMAFNPDGTVDSIKQNGEVKTGYENAYSIETAERLVVLGHWIETPEPRKLLTRREILEKDGIYKRDCSDSHFVTVGGECFIFEGDGTFYKSLNFDMEYPEYYEIKGKIVVEEEI